MTEENEPQLTSISKARTLDEIAEFWDTHSLTDFLDQTHEVEFEVRAAQSPARASARRRKVALDPEIYAQVETQARSRGVRPETLINLWVAERLKTPYTAMPAGG